LLEFPCAAVLIDTGGEDNDQFKGTDALTDYLDAFFIRRSDLNKTLASVILTHPHIDHTNGVAAVVANYTVKNGVTNGQDKGSGKVGQRILHQKIEAANITDVHVDDFPTGKGLTNRIIDPVKCPDVDPEITALWGTVDTKPTARDWTKEAFENQNNHSVAVRMRASLLIPGDLEIPAIGSLMARYKGTKLLDVDVYHVGHGQVPNRL